MSEALPGARLHVWFVNEYAVPITRPGGTRHHHLAQSLGEQEVDTTIIASDYGRAGPEQVDSGALFFWVPRRRYHGNGAGRMVSMLAFALRVLVAGWSPTRRGLAQPDVIVGSSPHLFGAFAAWMLARHHRCGFVLEVRDIWPLSLTGIAGVPPRHPIVGLLALMERFLCYRADEIVGLMEGLPQHVADVAPRTPARVTWIPNGTHLQPTPLRPKRLSAGGPFRVIYAGAHGIPNDLDTLLEAAAILESHDSSAGRPLRFQFDFYGDGVRKSAAEEFCRAHGLKSVSFHDPVPKSEVLPVIAGSDLCVIAWRNAGVYRYGISPNKLFDYFAAAKPVVMSTQLTDNIVTRSGAGLCPPAEDPAAFAEAIEKVAALAEGERAIMGAKGRAYVEAHHDTRYLAALYDEVIRRVNKRA